MNVDFYLVDEAYLDYLRSFDARVSENHDAGNERPFVAILASCLGIDYLIPLTHHTKKKNLGIFPLKIIHATHIENLGTLLINNMIPFRSDVATQFAIEAVTDEKYRGLLRKQWSILRDVDFQHRLEKAVHQAYRFQKNPLNKANPLLNIFIDYAKIEKAATAYLKK